MVTAVPTLRLLPAPGQSRAPEAVASEAPAMAAGSAATEFRPVEPIGRAVVRPDFQPEANRDSREAGAAQRERPAEPVAGAAATASRTAAADGLWTRLREIWSGLTTMLAQQEANPGPDRQAATTATQAYRQIQAMTWQPRRTIDLTV